MRLKKKIVVVALCCFMMSGCNVNDENQTDVEVVGQIVDLVNQEASTKSDKEGEVTDVTVDGTQEETSKEEQPTKAIKPSKEEQPTEETKPSKEEPTEVIQSPEETEAPAEEPTVEQQQPVEQNTEPASETQVESTEAQEANRLKSPFSISFLGDSITAGYYAPYSYADVVCEDLNAKQYNYGVSGNTLASDDGKGFVERYKNIHASEVIVVFGGSNDYYNDVPLGSPDSQKKDEFYGALKILCTGLKSTYPNSQIVFITPLRGQFLGMHNSGNNNTGSSMWDYVKAMQDVCAANDIPVIDLYHNFKINGDNYDEYTSDGLHPNEDGHKVIAQALESYIKSLM